jgi:hypothetical protein
MQPTYEGAANPGGEYPPVTWPVPIGTGKAVWIESQHMLMLSNDALSWVDHYVGRFCGRGTVALWAKDKTNNARDVGIYLNTPSETADDLPSFNVPAVLRIEREHQSKSLAHLMPFCKLSAPTGESMSYNANIYCWVFAFQTVESNDGDSFGSKVIDTLLGGSSGARKMGFTISEDGFYRVILNVKWSQSSTTSTAFLGVARFAANWQPPTVNYLAQATLKSVAVEYVEEFISATSSTTTNGQVIFDFQASAGDKIWPYAALNDVTKAINSQGTWVSIQRIG